MVGFLPWPYAAKAIIQHEFDTDHLNVWITFFFAMNQEVKPLDTKWIVKADTVEKPISNSVWQDDWTLLLTVPDVSSAPARVLVEYSGPGPETYDPRDPDRKTLEISWDKQWEGWGPILSVNMAGAVAGIEGMTLWPGLLSEIPAGWQLCDGSNGTPDLRCKIVTDKKILHFYPFLEGEGLRAFDSGTLSKIGVLAANVVWLEKGVTIAASASYVTAANPTFRYQDGSIEMLCRPAWNYDDGALHYFWWEGSPPTSYRFVLRKNADNTTELLCNSVSVGTFTYQWQANALYHVVLNWGANELYINNVLEHTFTPATLGTAGATLVIGDILSGANSAFAGNIYYFIVRDVTLTASEVAVQYGLSVEEKAEKPIMQV